MRSLSSMIDEVRSQTAEVYSVVNRMRSASRKLIGSTGEAPTQLASAKLGVPTPEPERPLLEQLALELERLNGATADLRNEMNHVENYSETGEQQVYDKATAYASQQGIASGIPMGYAGNARA